MPARVAVSDKEPSIRAAGSEGPLHERANDVHEHAIGGRGARVELEVNPLRTWRKSPIVRCSRMGAVAADDAAGAGALRCGRASDEWHDDLVGEPPFRTAYAHVVGSGK